MMALDSKSAGFGIGMVWSVGLVFALFMGMLLVIFYTLGALTQALAGSQTLFFGLVGGIFSLYGAIGGIVLALCYWAFMLRGNKSIKAPKLKSAREGKRVRR